MRPQLQVACDTTDMVATLGPLNRAAADVDIIECGTVLLLAEGVRAVREIRALYPDATILADARIAEAGSILARQCFAAGADWVSCVAGASLATVGQVVAVAREYGGQVQVELADEWYDADRARRWRELGVDHVIVKRSRDREAAGDLSWHTEDIERVRELAEMGFTVTITGGLKPGELGVFAGAPVGVIIAGRAILGADDPGAAAREFRAAIDQVWP